MLDDFSTPISVEEQPLKNIVVGIRTGFAFIKEPGTSRKRLVGVFKGNIARNNFFDGPFDQLPDSYAGKLSLKDMLEKMYPGMVGKVNEHGIYLDNPGARAVIDPYLAYTNFDQFSPLLACLNNSMDSDQRYRSCLKEAIGY